MDKLKNNNVKGFISSAFKNLTIIILFTILSTLVLIILFSERPDALEGDFAWAKSAGGGAADYGYGIGVDGGGNSYVTGSFEGTATFGSTILTSHGLSDFFIAKYDNTGNAVWAKSAGSTEYDSGIGIAVDTSGNSYVTGRFERTITFGTISLTSAGYVDVFVVKYDTSGNVVWAKSAGGSIYKTEYGTGIALDNAGNIYVAGRFIGTATFEAISLTSSGSYDGFVAKYDNDGNVLWAEKMGGGSFDYGYAVAVDIAGNSYVTGYFSSGTASFGSTTLTSAGSYDIFVAKLDTNGNILWANRAGGTGTDYGYGISVDFLGNSYLTGYFSGTANFGPTILTSAGGNDIFVSKYNSSGYVLWAKGTGGTEYDYGYAITSDSAGNSYVTGRFVGTVTFGTNILSSAGESDIFITKYDNNGSVVWAKSAGGNGTDVGYGITIDSAGNNYITGLFTGTATVGIMTLNSTGSTDIFVTKYVQEKDCKVICNPSFEDGLNYWTANGTPINQISTDSIDGLNSLYSEHTRTVNDAPSWSGVNQALGSAQSAETYTLSLWVKSLNASRGHVKIKWYDSGGSISQVDYPIININGTINDWTNLSKLVTSPPDVVRAELSIWHGINSSSQNVPGSTLWVDHIEFDIATGACGTLCNESFEHGTLYWTVSGEPGSHTIDTSGPHEGLKSLKSEQLYTETDPPKWAGVTQFVQVKEGTMYRLRVWLKKLNALNGHVRIRWRDNGGSILGVEYPIEDIDGTNLTWYKREAAVTPPAGATKAELAIWHGVQGNTTNVPGSTLWVDDITLICLSLCNGGFEDGYIHWETNAPNEGEIITMDVQEGTQAMKSMQGLDVSDNTQWTGVSQRLMVSGGTSYDLNFWIKKDNTVQGHVKIKWRDDDDQLISQEFPIEDMNGTDLTWTQMSTTLSAPANAESVEIFIWHGVDGTNQNAAGSRLYLDNITLDQIP